MFLRSSVVLLVLASCGGAEPHDPAAPTADEAPGCPSDAAPERCRDLAQAAASAGNNDLAWAYTVLECESPTGGQCAVMWQRYGKLAPTQTDALNVLHVACGHLPAACEQLAAWHTAHGHAQAAALYQKAQQAPATLAADLAALMHLPAPRTDRIAQMVGRELRAPVAHAAAVTKAKPKAWAMHAATLGDSSTACTPTALRDRKQVPLSECVHEVRPFDNDQIAVVNRCSQAVTVAYAGARPDRSTFVKQVRLEPYEAQSAGTTHRDVGQLTYAVCGGDCRVTSSPDDATASWTGQDAHYYCATGGH
jgi:hypothetical protein